MVRAEQNHALDDALSLGEQTVGGSGDITRVDVARMGRDHRLWDQGRRGRAREACIHSRGKFIGAGRVELSGEVGGLHGRAHIGIITQSARRSQAGEAPNLRQA
jgi:hypothetical protein